MNLNNNCKKKRKAIAVGQFRALTGEKQWTGSVIFIVVLIKLEPQVSGPGEGQRLQKASAGVSAHPFNWQDPGWEE